MPATPVAQTQASPAPAGIFSHWVLYTLLALFVITLIILATVSNYRAVARERDVHSREERSLWTRRSIFTRRSTYSKARRPLLGASLPLPTRAWISPPMEKQSTIVRGSRLSSPLLSFSSAPVLPPLAVYTLRPTSLIPEPHIPVPKAALSTGTTAPISTIHPSSYVVDLVR